MNQARPIHFLSSLSLAIFSLGVILLVGEITVRFFVPSNRWQFRDATTDWIMDERLGWVQKPKLDVITKADQGWTIRFRTNEDGLTPWDARRQKKEGDFRIMFVGDSTIVGRSVPDDKTINAYLEYFLGEKGIKADVINAGVQGYSTDQALLRMKQLLPLYHPDVVVYGACDNDFGGNVLDSTMGINKPRFQLMPDGSLQEIPPRLTKEIHSFEKGPAKWLQFSALYRFLQPRLFVLRARLGRWEERNLLGLSPEMYYKKNALDKIDWRIFTALINEMKKVAQRSGANFYFYTHPAIAEVWDPYIRDTEKKLKLKAGEYNRYAIESRFREVAKETGIHFIPLIDSFRERQSEGPFHLLPRDPHSNPAGYQLTAETIAKYLSQ